MPKKSLPDRPSLEHLKHQAKDLLKLHQAGHPEARARIAEFHPKAPSKPGGSKFTLSDAQWVVAREHGFASWAKLKHHIESLPRQKSPTAGRAEAVQAFLRAAAKGEVERVEELLQQYPDLVNERALLPGHIGKRTALHFAVGGSHERVIASLLGRGADPNIRDDGDNAMPLHFAVEKGDLGIIRLLVEHGAEMTGAGDFHELEIIGWATVFGRGDKEVVEYLLAHGARHNILSAVATGDTESIRRLAAQSPGELNRRMDTANRHRRPLHLAVVKKQAESLAVLLELGADTSILDEGGLTALDQAAIDGEQEMAQRLIERGAEVSLPAAVALERTEDIARWLGEDPDCLKPGQRWGHLIIRASEHGSGRVIESLVRAGASVNVRDSVKTAVDGTTDYTALHAAAFHGNEEGVRTLLALGADVRVRDGKYHGTPAGWANHMGHGAARDLILAGPIDIFEAIERELTSRLGGILAREPESLNRPQAEYLNNPLPGEGWLTPLACAVKRGRVDIARELLRLGADAAVLSPDGKTLEQLALENGKAELAELLGQARPNALAGGAESLDQLANRFLEYACPDHHVRGGPAHVMARHAAARLLKAHPEIARHSLHTAVACGELEEVERILRESPGAASEKSATDQVTAREGTGSSADWLKDLGAKGWEPLLYLCFTRLPLAAASDNAVAIARALLDRGADPKAFFKAGDSRYTTLAGVIGEGEEDRPAHPRRDELARLLLERGAEPYDIQVLYNIHFKGQALWYLKLIHEQSVKSGRAADWKDSNWPMLDMGGYGCGARYLLDIAVARNDLELASWCLEHGANPNAPAARSGHSTKGTLHQEALRNGALELAELLAGHGAARDEAKLGDQDEFVAACLSLDVDEAKRLAREHPEHLASTAALFQAARRDRVEVVRLLLDLGVSVNAQDRSGTRALHEAAYHDAAGVATLLIERGAEIDPRDSNHGATPYWFAIWGQRPRTMEVLARHSRDVWSLTFTGDVARLREVLRERPELARATGHQETLLMWLPDEEDRAVETVRLLLSLGADPKVRDGQGLTAAERARKRGLRAAAELLE